MIIVEGPDGAGKTTLIEKLSGELNLSIAMKVVDHNTNATTDLVKWVDHNLDQGLTPTLYDRHRLISEPIYGPVIRGALEKGFDDFAWLHTRQIQFRELKPLVIWCLPPLDVVMHNIAGDEMNEAVAAHIQLIYWLYWNEAAKWKSMSMRWDYTVDSFLGLKLSIQHWMERKNLVTRV